MQNEKENSLLKPHEYGFNIFSSQKENVQQCFPKKLKGISLIGQPEKAKTNV